MYVWKELFRIFIFLIFKILNVFIKGGHFPRGMYFNKSNYFLLKLWHGSFFIDKIFFMLFSIGFFLLEIFNIFLRIVNCHYNSFTYILDFCCCYCFTLHQGRWSIFCCQSFCELNRENIFACLVVFDFPILSFLFCGL